MSKDTELTITPTSIGIGIILECQCGWSGSRADFKSHRHFPKPPHASWCNCERCQPETEGSVS